MGNVDWDVGTATDFDGFLYPGEGAFFVAHVGGVEALLGRHWSAGFDEFVGGGKAFGDVVESG